MNMILEEIISGLPDVRQMASLVSRLLTAMILGALVGAQREQSGKPAGLRTHVLVAMGGALFVLAPLEAGMELGRNIAGDSGNRHGDRIYRGRRHSQVAGKKRDRRPHDGSRSMDDRRDWNRCRFRTIGSRIGKYDS